MQLDMLQFSGETLLEPGQFERRQAMVNQLLDMPHDVLLEGVTSLQFFETQTGCPNVCSFCSQGAATDVWRMDHASTMDTLAALRAVDLELQGTLDEPLEDGSSLVARKGGDRTNPPGVIFLYQDTDVASDPNLLTTLSSFNDEFGLKVRVSTVGWSRHNEGLQSMHEEIASRYPDAFDGFRLSITPYTDGVTEQGGRTSRDEYISDAANVLTTYRPLLETVGLGQDNFSVELRFAPMTHTQEDQIVDRDYEGHHVVQVGDVLVLSDAEYEELELTEIQTLDDGRPTYTTEGAKYRLLRSNSFDDEDFDLEGFLDEYFSDGVEVNDGFVSEEEVDLHRFTNDDGDYYAINPLQTSTGATTIHIYPSSETRVAGYNDATRHFLRAMTDEKADNGLERRDGFEGADWDNIQGILDRLDVASERIRRYSEKEADHIEANVRPIVAMYAEILKRSGYTPDMFFDRGFTIDTGQIVNQGRAKSLFNGLVSVTDMPFTPHEERGYGKNSFASAKGNTWRISPLPDYGTAGTAQVGLRNRGMSTRATGPGNILFGPVAWETLTPVEDKATILPGVAIDRVPLAQAREEYLLPGMPKAS